MTEADILELGRRFMELLDRPIRFESLLYTPEVFGNFMLVLKAESFSIKIIRDRSDVFFLNQFVKDKQSARIIKYLQ